MGAAASTTEHAAVNALREEVAKAKTVIIDTPRGVSAKEEVTRLRQLLASHASKIVESPEQVDESDTQQQLVSVPVEGMQSETSEEEREESSNNQAEAEKEDAPQERVECQHCSRKFVKERVGKHETVCLAKKCAQKQTAGSAQDEPVTTLPQSESDLQTQKANWRDKRKALKEKLRQDKLKQRQAAAANRPIAQVPEASQ